MKMIDETDDSYEQLPDETEETTTDDLVNDDDDLNDEDDLDTDPDLGIDDTDEDDE